MPRDDHFGDNPPMRKPTGGEPALQEPTLRVTATQWNRWLADHHASASGALVMITKKGGGPPALSYAEALEVALTWGWIDGQKRAHDERAWLQRFTPRRARSAWSKINRAKAEALIRAGKMHPSGLREVERAKQDGRWDAAYDSARTSQVPDELARALAGNKAAAAFFAELDAANRYAILYRVQTAKKPETRAARIARFVAMLAKRETLHPVRRSRGSGAPKNRLRQAR
jgi:uncharacterized protein YdeI (YjbR/CyaY-like superfamily)